MYAGSPNGLDLIDWQIGKTNLHIFLMDTSVQKKGYIFENLFLSTIKVPNKAQYKKKLGEMK